MANINAIIADLESKITRNRAYVENALAAAKRAGHSYLTETVDAECERRMDAMDLDKKALERAKGSYSASVRA